MEWFQLHLSSIAALASLMLCLTATFYLLSIVNKSKDGWRIMGIFIIFVFIHVTGFLITSSVEASWNKSLHKVQCLMSSISIIYLLWFIYVYRQNPFPREMRHVLIVSGLLFAVIWYFEPRVWLLTAPLHVLSFLWIFWVLLRKAEKASQSVYITGKTLNTVNGKSIHSIQYGELKGCWQALKKEFQHPSNRVSKAYRSLALWSLANFVFFFNLTLYSSGVSYNFEYWHLIHEALLLITIIWLILSYINYAEERTTFMAKLVGLFLCLILILLGLIGFLIYDEGAASGLIREQQEKGLKALAILLLIATFFIIVIIPIFLRSNLLRPLKHVLDGVKRVNEGDLTKKVDVEVNDEIGYLGQSFNHMIESLSRYSNEMESLVFQRTAELRQQKEELNNTLENLKATQTQLVQSAKMASLGELTAGIAHEIQNPLNFVNNFSEVSNELIKEIQDIRRKTQDGTQLSEEDEMLNDIAGNLEKINHHGKRASDIVKGMLQHSRTSSGVKEPTDINKLADEYLRLAYHGLRAKDKSFNATMKTDFDETIGNINIIPQDIGRVILNLITNAFYVVIEKSKQNIPGYEPTVSVSTHHSLSSGEGRGEVLIKVKDNGNGIPQKILDKIFQPFFTTKPTGQGTGLGLSLSYDIVKAHGGEIKVETKEGQGTQFIVVLPL